MTRLQKSVLLVGLGTLPFFAARLSLLAFDAASFAPLSWTEVLIAFATGLRFDLQVLLVALGIPLLLMNQPLRVRGYTSGGRWFRSWARVAFVPIPFMALVLAGDVLYFGHVQRHLADELSQIGNDAKFLVGEALGAYLPVLAAVVALTAVLGWLWWRVTAAPLRESPRPVLGFAVVCVCLVIGIRGTLDRKPMGLVDAYRRGEVSGNLSMNGVFSAAHLALGSGALDFGPPDDAAFAGMALVDTAYPVLHRPAPTPPFRNFVIVLLESWDRHFIDAYEGGGQGITPNFDRLASQGVRFDAFYAASQRSIESIQAALTGVPPIVGEPGLGYGLSLSRITRLGTTAREQGRRTIFLQSSRRRSYRLDSVARSLGFSEYYGMEDLPKPAEPEFDVDAKWGFDRETLRFAVERLDASDAPFLAFIFTGSTHTPYLDPGEAYRMVPHESHGRGGFINTLHYADAALGEFFAAASTRDWFSDTAFLLVADHVWRRGPADDLANTFRVPALLYAPGRIAAGVRADIRSHLDILPTAFALLGLDGQVATFGRALQEPGPGIAIVKAGDRMGLISREGATSYEPGADLPLGPALPAASSPSARTALDLKKRLIEVLQVTSHLLRANRWAPPDGQRPDARDRGAHVARSTP